MDDKNELTASEIISNLVDEATRFIGLFGVVTGQAMDVNANDSFEITELLDDFNRDLDRYYEHKYFDEGSKTYRNIESVVSDIQIKVDIISDGVIVNTKSFAADSIIKNIVNCAEKSARCLGAFINAPDGSPDVKSVNPVEYAVDITLFKDNYAAFKTVLDNADMREEERVNANNAIEKRYKSEKEYDKFFE